MSAKEVEESLKITKLTLLISGIKMEHGKWDPLFKILFQVQFLWIHSAIVGELSWVVDGSQNGKSFLELSYNIPCAMVCLLSSVKATFFFIHQDVFIEVVKKLINIHPEVDDKRVTDEKTIEDEELNDVVRRNVNESTTFLKYLIKLDLAICSGVIVAFALQPLPAMGYEYWKTGTYKVTFPYNVKYFFDPYSKAVWPFVYVYLVWASTIAFLNTFGTDTFFFAFCVYMRMHFRILQRRFQDAVCEREGRQIVEVVKRHQDVINLADQMEILYSKSTLFSMVTSSILICLCAFNATVMTVKDMGVVISFMAFLSMLLTQIFLLCYFGDMLMKSVRNRVMMMMMMMFLSISLTQIFLLCYFGDMLMKSSTEISDAIYNSQWYQADQRMKRNVLFVLSRSRIPCKLTASGFADVNMELFTSILGRSWSFFALLKTVIK
ncbi:odorant receptor 4-like [Cydia strobilella]|uniref:odorant receptor 4-like n=1 Tax=Cydia strobilella TaxID=1100964 RepID=UPI00300769EF